MLALLTMATAALVATPVAQATAGNKIEICIQTCIQLNDRPGYELRQCIAQCQAEAPAPRIEPADGGTRNYCETYEPECDQIP